jgi:glycosyltransferase involved in cell wall biosynthesis
VVADHEKFKLRSELTEEGIRIYEFPDLFFGRARSGWDLWCALRRILMLNSLKGSFDLVHIFETRPATIFPTLFYLKKNRIPLVIDWNDWWGRGGLIDENRPKWYAKTLGPIETYFEENFRRHGNAHTVVSDALRRRLIGLGVDPNIIHFVPNGADIDSFKPRPISQARQRLGLSNDRPILCFTGFDVVSDLDLVLNAFKEVVNHLSNVLLLLTGKKNTVAVDFSIAHKLQNNIMHLGYLDDDRLKDVIAASDVCLLPFRSKISNLGRFPGKLAEYLSMGKPIVSNNVGEVGRVLREAEAGLLADEDHLSFADRILLLLNDASLRAKLTSNARLYAEQTLAWKIIVQQLERVYLDLQADLR